MLLIFELLFIVLLVMILYTLYRNEHSSAKMLLPHALIEEYWSGKERRQHVRFDNNLDINYAIEKKPHIKNSGKTVDISEGGMKLLVAEKFSKGSILDLRIALPNPGGFIEIEGEVMWSEEAKDSDPDGRRLFYSGIRFSGVKESGGARLVDYVHSLASAIKEP